MSEKRRQVWKRVLFVLAALAVLAVAATLALTLARPSATAGATTTAQTTTAQTITAADSTTTAQTTTTAGTGVFASCEGCHPDYLTKLPATPGLIFSHLSHLARGAGCAQCHPTTAGHQGTPTPTMASCFACHDDKKAPSDCSYCHSNVSEIAPGLGQPSVHVPVSATDKATCVRCHDVPAFCFDCHGVVIPHPPDWLQTHGVQGQTNSQVCVKCHQSKDSQFCVRCHGMEMPHPAYWYSNHGPTVEQDPQSCNLCHKNTPEFCDSCHHAGFASSAAWLNVQHGAVVKQQGTGPCQPCHTSSFCARCHPQGLYVIAGN
jgi:hypothetical protein